MAGIPDAQDAGVLEEVTIDSPVPVAPPSPDTEPLVINEKVDVEEKIIQHPIVYRPDIDGLRCLAVVPVVLFHAYPNVVAGGFIGVDVFFVISGYLISSILFKQFHQHKFTYADFYSRRIRRIFPGLLLMMVFTIMMGCFWYLAQPLKNMAATLTAGALFGANLQVLSLKQGYFDASVKEDPLLHLWSLGVEEQFYIFWPFFASIIVKLSFRNAILAQLVVMIASFSLNIAMLGFHGDNNWSFYFPLCRFWQMSVGGLLAYMNMPSIATKQLHLPALNRSAISFGGLAMILVGFFSLTESSQFPGYWALLPTIGAGCLIFAGPDAPFNYYILSLSPVIFIGKISYALYLWHWPLLVYAKARYPSEDGRPWPMQPYSMLLLAVVLSVFTLYGVENKLRHRKSNLLVPILFGGMMCIAALGVAMLFNPSSFSMKEAALGQSQASVISHVSDEVPNMSKHGAVTIKPTYASLMKALNDWHPDIGYISIPQDSPYATPTSIKENEDDEHRILNPGNEPNLVFCLGDSHMHMTKPRFNYLWEQAKAKSQSFPTFVFKCTNGVPPLTCMGDHQSILNTVKAVKPKVVFYASDWPQFIRPGGTVDHGNNPPCCNSLYRDNCEKQSPKDAETLIRSLQNEIAEMTSSGIKVFVATLNPEGAPFHFKNMLSGEEVIQDKIGPVSRQAYKTKRAYLIDLLETAVKAANGTIIDFSDNQCDGDSCEVVSPIYGEPIMKDTDHFRPAFAREYLSVVDQVAQAALN